MKYLFPILLISFSLICIRSFHMALSYFETKKASFGPIRLIAQTGPVKEGLKTEYLAQLLNLSADQPKSISPEEAKKILEKHPLIKKVSTSYWPPETLYIDYTMRRPLFTLADVETIGVDVEGFFFPLRPYFTPKRLPELYLGVKDTNFFDHPLGEKERVLALDFLAHFKQRLKRLDLSKIDAPSLGKREIVVLLESCDASLQILRLSPKGYQRRLSDYEKLNSHLRPEKVVIDLRLPDLAYVTPIREDS